MSTATAPVTISASSADEMIANNTKLERRIGLADLVEILNEKLVGMIPIEVACNDEMKALMESFSPEVDDTWRDFALYDDTLPYTRNLVAAGDDFDLIMICWNPRQRSQIHNHPGSNCWLRVVQGVVTERLFDLPSENADSISVIPTKVTDCSAGYLAYINDSIGLHQVCNDTDEPAITLHLYCPRHTQCTVFNDSTGAALRKNMCFYSVFGERVQLM